MPDRKRPKHSNQLKVENQLSGKEKNSILKTFITILLIFLCLIAARWQFQRGVNRHHNNSIIIKNSALAPLPLNALLNNVGKNEWRTVSAIGQIDTSHDVLLRNSYNDGKYGFEYLSLFEDHSTGKQYWLDRGWVKAGETALARPKLPSTPSGEIEVVGRIRLDNGLPRGSFFALPASGNLISKWDLQGSVTTANFYLDLISGPGVTPAVPAQLPELTDGPHFAYALQWLFFAGLIGYGRILIRKR